MFPQRRRPRRDFRVARLEPIANTTDPNAHRGSHAHGHLPAAHHYGSNSGSTSSHRLCRPGTVPFHPTTSTAPGEIEKLLFTPCTEQVLL